LAQDEKDWTKPQAMAIPKEGYFELQQGKYGPVYPKTPACHGFTIIAKIKPGREEVIRGVGVGHHHHGRFISRREFGLSPKCQQYRYFDRNTHCELPNPGCITFDSSDPG